MAQIGIYQLPEADTLTGDESIPIDKGADTRRATVAMIREGLLPTAGDGSAVLVKGRTLDARAGDAINVKDGPFLAHGNGLADDTTAIQAAIDALPATGGDVFLPPGIYQYTTLTLSKPVRFRGAGDGDGGTILRQISASADGLVVTGGATDISGIRFVASLTKTAGRFVVFTTSANRSRIHRCTFVGYRRAIEIGVIAGCDVYDCFFYEGVEGVGAGVEVVRGYDLSLRSLIMGADTAHQPLAGIILRNTGDIGIADCNITAHGTNLLIAPGDGQAVTSVYGVVSYFDSGYRGMHIAPTGSGAVKRCRFTGCWFGGSVAEGVLIAGTGDAVDGVELIGADILLNGGVGAYFAAGINNRLIGGTIAANGNHGVYAASGVSHWAVLYARIGAASGLPGNAGYAVAVAAGASDHYAIMGNDLTGNVTGAISNGGVGLMKRIEGNIGAADVLRILGVNSGEGWIIRRHGPTGKLMITPEQDAFNGVIFQTKPSGTLIDALTINADTSITHGSGTTVITPAGHIGLRPYTVATLPAASPAHQSVAVSDRGARPAWSTGSAWIWADGSTVS